MLLENGIPIAGQSYREQQTYEEEQVCLWRAHQEFRAENLMVDRANLVPMVFMRDTWDSEGVVWVRNTTDCKRRR